MAKAPEWKSLLVAFLIGGITVTAIKYVATHLKNPALAAILGGLPIGALSIYLLTPQASVPYSYNYFFVTLSTLTTIMVFYLLITHTKMSKDIVLGISILFWLIVNGIRYFLTHKK